MIPESHPLRTFFLQAVQERYIHSVGVIDNDVCSYVSNVLTEFCHTEQLYKIRDANGRPLHDVGEMLLESDPVYGAAASFGREREVRKHIGDYTLFFTGMFPESINHFRLRRARLEGFVDFMKAGKESYTIVSKFDQYEYEKEAPLFAKLAEKFELCVYGLNLVKSDLDAMQHPVTRQVKEFLM
jgi:hypothetical protein